MPPHAAADHVICHRCGALVPRGCGAFWEVRVEAVADPSPPGTPGTLEAPGESAADLLAEVAACSERELMDQVHRAVRMQLCARCFEVWIDLGA